MYKAWEKTSLTPRDHELRYLSKLPHGEILVEDPVLSRPQARVDSLNPSLSLLSLLSLSYLNLPQMDGGAGAGSLTLPPLPPYFEYCCQQMVLKFKSDYPSLSLSLSPQSQILIFIRESLIKLDCLVFTIKKCYEDQITLVCP